MTKFKRRQVKQKPQADAILSADWHIRPDTPVCRTDNFWEAQEKKINFILDLREQHGCPLLIAGDLGDYPLNRGWPTWLSRWAIKKFKGHHIVSICGQHDLPNHRLDLWEKSGIGILEAAGVIKVLGFNDFTHTLSDNPTIELAMFPYGKEIQPIYKGKKPDWPVIAMTHEMVIESKKLWPGQVAPKGHQLLKKFPEYSLILTGDNHNPFVCEYQGRLLVNPGSLMRTTASQESHRPRVYLWWAETNEIEAVYLPIEDGVISREHIDMAEERSDRMDAFVARVRDDVEIALSYEDNVENYLKRFRTEKPVVTKIWEHVV